MNTIIVIPTYNEVEHIEKLIYQILSLHPQFDILIVDDNSPDGTGRAVEELLKKIDRIKILHRPKKSGLGKAYIEGFKYILASKLPYDRIIQMDADFSHNPKYLDELLKATENKDISIGSRYVPGGKILDWRLIRKTLSSTANLCARFCLGINVKDSTSGFRCFRSKVLTSIQLETIRSNGYLFQIELLTRCLRRGYSFTEVPIIFIERKEGETKFGFYEAWEATWGMLRLCFLKK